MAFVDLGDQFIALERSRTSLSRPGTTVSSSTTRRRSFVAHARQAPR